MIECKQLIIEGFRSVNSPVVLDYTPGSFVVQGDNGAGKSTIAEEAMWWLLSGTSLRGQYIENIINRDNDTASVTGQFEVPGIGAATMQRTRDNKNKKSFTFVSQAGVDLLAGAGTTQAAFKSPIENIFGMTLATLKATSFYSPERGILALQDTERRTLIESVLNLDWITKASDNAKKSHKEASYSLNQLERDYAAAEAAAQAQKNGAETLKQQAAILRANDTAVSQNEIKAAQEKANALTDKAPALLTEIQTLQQAEHGQVNLLQPLQLQEQELQKQVRQIQQGQAGIQASQAAAQREVERAQQKAQGITEGADCPTCLRPFTAVDVTAAQGTVQAEIDKAAKLNQDLAGNLQTMVDALNQLQAIGGPIHTLQQQQKVVQDGLLKAQEAVRLKQQEQAILAREITSAKSILSTLLLKAEQTDTAPQLAKLKEAVAKAEQDANESAAKAAALVVDISTATEKAEHLAWWKTAFSAKGLRAYILEGALPGISKAASYYLGLMFNHTMSLEIHPTRKNKDGTTAEVLDFSVKNLLGIDTVADLSTGERRVVDIALTLALADTARAQGARSLNFLILDESMGPLDPSKAVAVSQVLALLGDTQNLTTTVVAHSAAVKACFNKALNVARGRDGWTEIQWSNAD